MTKRKTFIDKVENVFNITAIRAILLVAFIVALFISGFLISTNFILIPLNNSQFEFYEKVARDVYEQNEQILLEVPEGVKITKTETSITVSSSDTKYTGEVVAKLKNGELIFTRSSGLSSSIKVGCAVGVIFILVGYLFASIFHGIYNTNR